VTTPRRNPIGPDCNNSPIATPFRHSCDGITRSRDGITIASRSSRGLVKLSSPLLDHDIITSSSRYNDGNDRITRYRPYTWNVPFLTAITRNGDRSSVGTLILRDFPMEDFLTSGIIHERRGRSTGVIISPVGGSSRPSVSTDPRNGHYCLQTTRILTPLGMGYHVVRLGHSMLMCSIRYAPIFSIVLSMLNLFYYSFFLMMSCAFVIADSFVPMTH
jgi:hypothetical protein